MIGFLGCSLRAASAAERFVRRMKPDASCIAPWCACFGAREAAGARDGDDWVVVTGYVRGPGELDARAVLAHLRARGECGVVDLEGEFALAAHVRAHTFLARDRYGTRPLYHARIRGGHAFATAIAPLVAAGIPVDVDRAAVVTSLVLGYAPAPATALMRVRQVPPGAVVRLFGETARSFVYYTPRERVVRRSIAASARVLDRALTRAVEHAPTRGRIGAFLSGGLDSSLVLARLCELGRDVEAYTLHFGDKLPGEIRYAEAVARHVHVRHHVLVLDARTFTDAIDRALDSLEDLLSEPISVPNYLLAREAARTRNVIFTGEGGDPIFGGPKNVGMVLERAYGARRLGIAYMSAHHHLADDLDIALTPEWRGAFDDAALSRDIERRIAPRNRETFVGRLMVTNLTMKGGSNILVKVSKMVGAHGLTLRSPLFDRDVIEVGLTIAPWHKLYGTDEKIVLKRAVARSLPDSVVYRPKRGMSIPLRSWFGGALGQLARDVLSPRRVKERGIFRTDYVERLLALERLPSDLARSRGAEKLWLVLVCELHQRALERMARPS